MKFLEDYVCFEEIGRYVSQLIDSKEIKIKDLAELLYERYDLGRGSTDPGFISEVRKGAVILPWYHQETKKDRLQRLSFLLHALNADENAEQIKKLKEKYPSFEYPPQRLKPSDYYSPESVERYDKLNKSVGNKIRERIATLGMSHIDLSRLAYEKMGVSEYTARHDIINYLEGYVHAGPEMFNGGGREIRELEKLAAVLHILNIGEEDELIQRMKGAYINFVYPPENNREE